MSSSVDDKVCFDVGSFDMWLNEKLFGIDIECDGL